MSENSEILRGKAGDKDRFVEADPATYSVYKKGLTFDEIVQKYNKWAGSYEKDLSPVTYRGPQIAAEYAAKYFSDEGGRGNVALLDVAAGTGFLGTLLQGMGFTTIDALDPSRDMLNKAGEKGAYRELVCDKIGPVETKLGQDTYDAVVMAGGMGEGHVPCSGLLELIRIVKPGGVVVIVMREEYLRSADEYAGSLEPTTALLEKVGLWRTEERTIVPNYVYEKNGLVYVFRVLVNGTDWGQIKHIENIKNM